MANALLPIALVSSIVTAGAVVFSGPNPGVNTKAITIASAAEKAQTLPDSKVWLLSSKGKNDICILTKLKPVSRTTSVLDTDPSCVDVLRDSEHISVWQHGDEGIVTLADNQGFPIIEFAYDGEGELRSISGEVGTYLLSPNS